MDGVLKEELGQLYVGVPGFFDAYFGSVTGLTSVAQAVFDKCKEGDNPLYREESGWQGWPEGARERDVLSWFAPLTGQLLDFAAENQPASRPRRRPLAQPHQRVHQEDDPGTSLVVKDSWQYPECEEEGELLCEAAKNGVVNVARYFHHETVRVGGKDDDIRTNVRKGLDITKATKDRPEKIIPPPSTGRQASRKDGSSSVVGCKRSSSCADAPLPPSKRTCSSSPTKPVLANRVHRRVIVRDYGKPIYKASSRTSLLAALEGCIEGYESLHKRAGLLQCDISPNNLMVNEDEENPSQRAFLIDLDLAIKEQREKASGARGKTGTRAFMAIGVLLDEENHSFMHDLESFFWVLFWICIHYDGPGKDIGATEFEKWNYVNMEELAELKLGLVSRERHFLNRITKAFTPYYQPLIPHVNKLRRVVFLMDKPWENEDRTLYSRMKEILRNAQKDLEGSEQSPLQEDKSD